MTQRPRATPGQYLFWSIALLCGVALYCRLQGADPASLRLDDQWLAIVARQMTVAEFVALRPPVPFGFAMIQSVSARLIPDPELGLQILPIAASVVQLPLMALLVWRLTGSGSLAFLGASLLSVSPTLSEYAVTAKHYTCDSFLSVALLLVGTSLLRGWSTGRGVAFIVAAVAGLCFSFPSILVSLAVLNVALILNRPTSGRDAMAAACLWAGFHLLLGVFYWVWLRNQSNESMQLYWAQHFMAFDSAAAVWRSLRQTIWSAMAGAFPAAIQGVAFLAGVGLIAIVVRPKYRSLGICVAVLYGGALILSALSIYPLGAGRTDSYLHPVTIVLVLLSINSLMVGQASDVRESDRARRDANSPLPFGLARGLSFVVVIAGVAVLVLFTSPSLYEPGEDSLLAKELERRASPTDSVIIYPHAEFAIGYYTAWPKQVRPCQDYAHGFELAFDRENTLKLPPPNGTPEYPVAVDALVSDFLGQSDGRLFYLATHIFPPGHSLILQVIQRQGYRASWNIDRPNAQLFLFERSRSDPQ